jgi:hypothetical protein
MSNIADDGGQLGRLNLLTPARVLAATKLIKTGETIGLKYTHPSPSALPCPCPFPAPLQLPPTITPSINVSLMAIRSWQANLPYPAMFERQNFEYKLHKRGETSYDDIYSMNTQSGSQWDGFRHVSQDLANGPGNHW